MTAGFVTEDELADSVAKGLKNELIFYEQRINRNVRMKQELTIFCHVCVYILYPLLPLLFFLQLANSYENKIEQNQTDGFFSAATVEVVEGSAFIVSELEKRNIIKNSLLLASQKSSELYRAISRSFVDRNSCNLLFSRLK